MASTDSLFQRIGGLPTLRRVHKLFYDELFRHEWLGRFFAGIEQHHLESQQTNFMSSRIGGPSVYHGALPVPAHTHIYITDELFTERSRVLGECLKRAGVKTAEAQEWLKIDEAFRSRLVKESPSECKGRFNTDPILNYPKPFRRRAG